MVFDENARVTRRGMLALGGGLVAGALAGRMPAAMAHDGVAAVDAPTALPVAQIAAIMRADATVTHGLVNVEIAREDLNVTGPGGVPMKPPFQIQGDFYWQALGGGQAILNADISLLASEIQPVIDALLAHGLTMQALHQHFYGLDPQLWFVHFRGVGDPLALAEGAAAMVAQTAAPLPQHSPPHLPTPLDPARLARIVGGEASVGSNGTVTVTVPRRERITLGGVPISPFLNVASTVVFEPLDWSPDRVAVSPDFALIASEVDPVMRFQRDHGWQVHCLYNQETAEHPQLYFSHQLKVGATLDLAREVRRALELTGSRLR